MCTCACKAYNAAMVSSRTVLAWGPCFDYSVVKTVVDSVVRKQSLKPSIKTKLNLTSYQTAITVTRVVHCTPSP